MTWRFTPHSAKGELVLNELYVDADVAEAINRGEAVATVRPYAHRSYEGEEARARMEDLPDSGQPPQPAPE